MVKKKKNACRPPTTSGTRQRNPGGSHVVSHQIVSVGDGLRVITSPGTQHTLHAPSGIISLAWSLSRNVFPANVRACALAGGGVWTVIGHLVDVCIVWPVGGVSWRPVARERYMDVSAKFFSRRLVLHACTSCRCRPLRLKVQYLTIII